MALLQISEPGQSPDPHARRIAVGGPARLRAVGLVREVAHPAQQHGALPCGVDNAEWGQQQAGHGITRRVDPLQRVTHLRVREAPDHVDQCIDLAQASQRLTAQSLPASRARRNQSLSSPCHIVGS